MRLNARRLQAGLNLLEVLIATLVLSVGLLGLAGLQVSSLKTTQNASLKQEATFILYDLLERMRSNRQAVLAGHYLQTTDCNHAPPQTCTATSNCSAGQQAGYELYQAVCQSGSNRLPAAQLIITCPANAKCDLGLHFLLTWQERLEQDGIQQTGGVNARVGTTSTEQDTEVMSLEMDVVI